MVKIIDIADDRSFSCIILDNGEKYWIRSIDVAASGFYAGLETDYRLFLQKIRVLQYPRALNLAVSMLARRTCSKREILNRLRLRHVSDDVSDLVLYKLEKENLVNDAEFSEQWVRIRHEHGFGPALIRQELKAKGISSDLIDAALETIDPEIGTKKAEDYARKIWRRIGPVSNIRLARQKIISTLVRKGYDWDTARSACDAIENKPED